MHRSPSQPFNPTCAAVRVLYIMSQTSQLGRDPYPKELFVRALLTILVIVVVGCDTASKSPPATGASPAPNTAAPPPPPQQTLLQARTGFVTKVVKSGEPAGPADAPVTNEFQLIRYQSPVGALAAYVTPDPGDGQKRPAIVWITGGDNNSIGDVWSPPERANDQSASAFRKAGIVVMFPSQRGGNDNPGQREGFYGEVDDILAATEQLRQLPYVDASRIYLGGHSTGGTLAMVIAACSEKYRAIFSLGPVADVQQYGGQYVYCDPNEKTEMRLRSPIHWMHCVKSPTYVFEGAEQGNWDGAIEVMARTNSNPKIQFFKVPGLTHFSVIAPVAEMLADQIVKGEVNVTQQTVQGLR